MTADAIEIYETVERAFDANRKHSGQICEIPILGGHYVPGFDRTKRLRKRHAVRLPPANGSPSIVQPTRRLYPSHTMSVKT